MAFRPHSNYVPTLLPNVKTGTAVTLSSYYISPSPPTLQFEYQQAQLEVEIENLSYKVERAETTDTGVSASARLQRAQCLEGMV